MIGIKMSPAPQVEEVTLTLEPEPCSLTPSPLREEASRGPSPGVSTQSAECVAERTPFDVTPCVVRSLEDEEAEEGSVFVVATN